MKLEARRLTPDIVVLRDPADRAVLVRGKRSFTAIDLPGEPGAFTELLEASRKLARFGLDLAILTRDRDDAALPGDGVSTFRLVRRDRQPQWKWDTVPGRRRDSSGSTVQLLRSARTLHDDAGRSFYCEPRRGSAQLLDVLIQPEEVLVVPDDLNPELPPKVGEIPVRETIARYRAWLTHSPKALVPASGIPLEREQLRKTLDRCARYLDTLYAQVRSGIVEARWPWERLALTIPWTAHWQAPRATPELLQRHKANIREMAWQVWSELSPESVQPPAD